MFSCFNQKLFIDVFENGCRKRGFFKENRFYYFVF